MTKTTKKQLQSSTRLPTWEKPDLRLLSDQTIPPPRFPPDMLGDVIWAWVITTAAALNVPVDYVAAAFIISAASVIGNTRVASRRLFREACVLWGLLVGEPSSGKTPPIVLFQRILAKLEAELRSGELGDFWEPDCEDEPQLVVSDATPPAAAEIASYSPRGFGYFNDEYADFLRRYSGVSYWLSAWMGGPQKVVRKKQPPIMIRRFSISVLGGCQPEPLRSIAQKADQGFLARWLMFYADRQTHGRHKATDTRLAERVLRKLARLKFDRGEPVEVKFSKSADRAAETWSANVQSRARQHTGVVAGWLNKAPMMTMRLSLILEFLWWAASDQKAEPDEISLRAYRQATNFIDAYAYPMFLRTLNMAATPREEQHARLLVRVLQRQGLTHFNARELRRTGGLGATAGPLTRAENLTQAIEVLVECGLVRHVGVKAGSVKGGRPPGTYEVNPVLFDEQAAA